MSTPHFKRVWIMVGIPGSGKSTLVRELRLLYPGMVVCSADDYFTQPDGEYRFDARKLAEAHDACKRKFVAALRAGSRCVVVDNTNASAYSRREYTEIARDHGYSVVEAHVQADPEEAYARNVHGVPREKVLGMAKMLDERFR